jgi:ankyrin repeat protein
MLAADGGHEEIFKKLVNRGADVTAAGFNGHNALHRAAKAGCEEAVKLTLSKPQCDPNQRDRIGQSPLFLACKVCEPATLRQR